MKSNICSLTGRDGELDAVLKEVEKCTAYNGLEKESALRVHLLAEELVGMLPMLLERAEGCFWAENDGSAYELHVRVKARAANDYATREKLISMSSSGKNAANTGIMGRIRAAAELLLFPSASESIDEDFIGFSEGESAVFSRSWSMREYANQMTLRQNDPKHAAAWDELEKSIVTRLADDVVVGIKGSQVEIIVRKNVNL